MCGRIGLAPNTAIAYSTWKAFYYTDWGHNNCGYWGGKWVAVLRKSGGQPSIATTNDFATTNGKDPAFGPTFDSTPGIEYVEPSTSPVMVLSSGSDVASLDASFQKAAVLHGLVQRPELSAALERGHITKVISVHSLVTTFPDYLLAVVAGQHGRLGVAMFTLEDPHHPQFAGMTVSDEPLAQYPLVNAAQAGKALATSGVAAVDEPELVWGWSKSTTSPYYPMWRANTDQGVRYVTSLGQVTNDIGLLAPAGG